MIYAWMLTVVLVSVPVVVLTVLYNQSCKKYLKDNCEFYVLIPDT